MFVDQSRLQQTNCFDPGANAAIGMRNHMHDDQCYVDRIDYMIWDFLQGLASGRLSDSVLLNNRIWLRAPF